MHLPDGYLNDPTCTLTTAAAIVALGAGAASLRRTGQLHSPAALAAVGAGIFAVQMVNYPIDHGTSGHVLGAATAAILLGPAAGIICVAMVLLMQCALFGDGGVSTLGANAVNMAVIGVLSATAIYRAGVRVFGADRGRLPAAVLAGLGSVFAAAIACSLELAASGTYGLSEVASAMLRTHLAIGVVEGLFTAAIFAVVWSMAERTQFAPRAQRRSLAVGVAAAFAVALLVAPLASQAPDGLERVAAELNFDSLASSAWSLAPGYALSGIDSEVQASALAAIVGVAAVLAALFSMGKVLTAKVAKRRPNG